MKDIKTLFQMYQQLMYILNKSQKRRMVCMFILVLLGALLETLGVSSLLPFVQVLSNPTELLQNPKITWVMDIVPITEVRTVTIVTGVLVIIVFILKNIGLAISSYSLVRFKAHITRELKYQMMQSYMNQPYLFFVNSETGDILRGVTGDVDSVRSIIDYIFHILTEGLVIILIGLYVIYIDPIIAFGVALVGAICFFVIVLSLKKRMSRLGLVGREAEKRAYSLTTQIVYGIKDIIVRQKRKVFLDRFDDANAENCKAQIGSEFANVLPERLIEAICIGGIIGAALFRIVMNNQSENLVPIFAVFAVAAFRMLPAISRITGYINLLIYGRVRLEGAYETIKSSRKYVSEKNEDIKEKKSAIDCSFKRQLVIDHIYWYYNDVNGDVLSNLSLKITKGESIGIIGESGSGKSTLSDILLGLYKPQKGKVEVDGRSIFDIPENWAKMMGYVPQTVYLLDDTIRNNVAFGEDMVDDFLVLEALEKASLRDFVEGLPEGLDTIVGESGIRFSGGQRQRIAIARALYTNPSILILDEATSALDNDTENAVMESIESLQGIVTLIIIAHRLTTIQKCDRIIKICDGQAMETTIEK